MLDIIIAIVLWFVLGGIISFIFGMISVSIGSYIDKHSWGVAGAPVTFSIVRLCIVFYIIKFITNIPFASALYICLSVADIAWGMRMMLSISAKWGESHNISMLKTGTVIGSVLFLVVFLVKFHL